MRVILDTNIFLSALISPGGTPDQIYHAWRDRKFILVTSVAQLDELRRASHYPKLRAKISTHRFGELINAINGAAVLDRLPEAAGLADPHDEFLLGMASAGQADYLVTGDGRSGLLQRGHAGRTRDRDTSAVFGRAACITCLLVICRAAVSWATFPHPRGAGAKN